MHNEALKFISTHSSEASSEQHTLSEALDPFHPYLPKDQATALSIPASNSGNGL